MRLRHRWFVLALLAVGLAFPASVLADAPTATAQTPTTLEDHLVTVDLAGDDADGDALTFSIATSPSAGSLGSIYNVSCDGQTPSHCTANVDYTPNLNYAGSDSFTYVANDGTSDSSAASVDITITGVNDPPSFTDGGDKTVNEDSGAASYLGWASNISRGGGADESGQTVSFSISNVQNGSLLFAGPAVSAAGTLSFTPADDAFGSVTFDVNAVDTGGTTNGGDDTSGTHSITITINPVNDAPSFTDAGDQSVAEDSGQSSYINWASSPSVGPSNESTQTYSYSVVSNDHPAYFSAGPAVATNGTLSFTPAANANGVATVGVQIVDSGGTANGGVNHSTTHTFTLTITPVNDKPAPQNDFPTVIEDAAATPIDVLANDNTNNPDGVETLTIVSVDTTGTGGTVQITGGGTGLTYQPPIGFQGQDLFTYTVEDPGLLQGTATVLVTVGPDNVPPVGTPPVESVRTGVAIGATGVQVHVAWSATDAGLGVGRYLLQMSTDGGAYATITLATPTTTSINRTLTVGHRYQFRMRPYDKNNNPGALKYGPQFQVSRIEDSSSLSKFSATVWHVTSNTSDSGGSAHYTYANGATATLTLSGRDYAIVVPKNSFRGPASIYVDGVFNATITEKTGSSTTSYRQVIWSIHFATPGTHVIQIRTTSTSRFDLDAFVALR